MKKNTLLIAVAAIVLAVITAASVTVAWLTAESNQVTNTFTYGEIALELWENPLDSNGNFDANVKNTTGLTFEKIVPGDVVKKNPTVTVKSGSEKCFVYVLVTNKLISDAENPTTPVATLNIGENWKSVQTIGNSVLYRYTTDPQTPGDFLVFDTVTFNTALTLDDVLAMKDNTNNIIIKAYAHQSDNTNMNTADTAAIAWATTNAN